VRSITLIETDRSTTWTHKSGLPTTEGRLMTFLRGDALSRLGTAGRSELAQAKNRGKPIVGRQRGKPLAMGIHERAATDEQCASSALDERFKGCLDVADALGIENNDRLPDCLRRRLHLLPLGKGLRIVWIHEHGDRCRLGRDLAQQFQQLRPCRAGKEAYA